MNDPTPINRIKNFVASPFPSQPRAATEEGEETVEDTDDEDDVADESDDDDDDALVGDGDDDDGNDDDGDESDSDYTPENYLRTKVYLAMEDTASLTFGKAIIHEDPLDEDKLLLVMQIDKFTEDEEMPDLDGSEMRDVSVILAFEGKGHEGPKKRILSLDKLAQLFDPKNWKKNRSKK